MIAIVALLVSGLAVAAKKPSGSRITGCYSKKGGVLRVIQRNKRCKGNERKIRWTKNGARGTRGIRGARGPNGATGPPGVAGATGPSGSRGATGPTGPTGNTGPSNAFEVFNTGPVPITGTDTESATSLATLSAVPAGSYVLTARVQLNGSTTTAARVLCTASLGTRFVRAISDIGSSAGNVMHDVVSVTFTVTLVSTATANLRCHRETLTGTEPSAADSYLELLKVATASSESVAS